MASITIFKGFNKPVEDKSLIQIIEDIKEGKCKNKVLKVRALAQIGNKDGANKLKKTLPGFTPTGRFEDGRKLEYLKKYSGFIVLDLDDLTTDQLNTAFTFATCIPYTFCCFRSPKGNGLKILVEVTSTAEYHEQAYKQVADYYEQVIDLPIDRKGKDIARLCFVSYDPDLYMNINNEKFQVKIDSLPGATPKRELTQSSSLAHIISTQYELVFEMQVDFTNKKMQYSEGNRNNYIYLLASNCNRVGVPAVNTISYCIQYFDLEELEIKQTVESAYTHHNEEFAKFADIAALQITERMQPEEDFLKNTPFVPDELYLQMPKIIREGAEVLSDYRERDVFLTGALAILSGCLPRIKGIYDRQEVFPNLFTFIVAPAASGKGALKFAKMLADEHHNTVLKESRDAELLYNVAAAAYKQQTQNKRKSEEILEEPPLKPPFKVVYVPANTSYAKILWHLEQNSGSGIICETEADTLGNTFKQEWGSYSDMLRKAFHHEKISSSKKNNNEFIEVDTPSISIALSGTPNQVAGLIESAEDGLFSRFLFYVFTVTQNWKDVSPNASGLNLTEHFRSLSSKVHDMVSFLEKHETEITLSREQWDLLQQNCKVWLSDITTFTDEAAASIVKRLGLIMYRMAMIFTAMRKFENGDMTTKVLCTDSDFNIALKLSKIYMEHSILMFNNLPKQKGSAMFAKSNYKQVYFHALPQEFTRAEALTLGETFKMSTRNVDDFLSSATNSNFLTKPTKPGSYKKL